MKKLSVSIGLVFLLTKYFEVILRGGRKNAKLFMFFSLKQNYHLIIFGTFLGFFVYVVDRLRTF